MTHWRLAGSIQMVSARLNEQMMVNMVIKTVSWSGFVGFNGEYDIDYYTTISRIQALAIG